MQLFSSKTPPIPQSTASASSTPAQASSSRKSDVRVPLSQHLSHADPQKWALLQQEKKKREAKKPVKTRVAQIEPLAPGTFGSTPVPSTTASQSQDQNTSSPLQKPEEHDWAASPRSNASDAATEHESQLALESSVISPRSMRSVRSATHSIEETKRKIGVEEIQKEIEHLKRDYGDKWLTLWAEQRRAKSQFF